MEDKIELPFGLNENEVIKYNQPSLKISLQGSNENFDFEDASLVLTNQRFLIYANDKPCKVAFTIQY